MTRNRALWSILWALAFLAGLYGLYLRFSTGHSAAAYGSAVPWGLWVALYSFMSSMAAGLYLLSSLPVLFGVRSLEPVVRPGLWASLASLVGGLVAIGLDLGHIFRAYEVFTRPNPSSVMAALVWLYTLFAILLVVQLLALRQGNETAVKRIAWVGIFLAVAMAGAGGALYATAGSRVFWHSGFLPILVIAGGLLTGAALLLFLVGLESPKVTAAMTTLGRVTLGLVVLDLVLEWAEFSVGTYGGDMTAVESARLVLFGPYAWAFWGLHLAVGSIVPLLLLAGAPQKRWAQLTAGLLVVGTYLTVRLNIVIPPLTVPQLAGLPTAYVEPGLSYMYSPSLMEWLVALFAVTLAVLVFYVGYRFLAGRPAAGATTPAVGKEA